MFCLKTRESWKRLCDNVCIQNVYINTPFKVLCLDDEREMYLIAWRNSKKSFRNGSTFVSFYGTIKA